MKKIKNDIIEKDGEIYTVVTLSTDEKVEIRHPKGRDLKFAMSSGANGDIGAMIFALASNLTCKTEQELEEMNIKDTSLIVNVVSGFLG